MKLPLSEIENNVYEVDIDVSSLRISKKEIEFNIGYPENAFPDYFSGIIDDILLRLPELTDIKAGYRVANATLPEEKADGLYVGDVFFSTDRIVLSQLKGSESIALFACTIGDGMEKWSKQLLTEGDPARSYLVDCVASAAAESAVNFLHDYIAEKMKTEKLRITNRYSPGYCKWPVSDQHLLFSFLPDNFCGITLSESALMTPIKSVTGIIGIGKDVKWREYLCDRCGVHDCTHRAKRLERLQYKK